MQDQSSIMALPVFTLFRTIVTDISMSSFDRHFGTYRLFGQVWAIKYFPRAALMLNPIIFAPSAANLSTPVQFHKNKLRSSLERSFKVLQRKEVVISSTSLFLVYLWISSIEISLIPSTRSLSYFAVNLDNIFGLTTLLNPAINA